MKAAYIGSFDPITNGHVDVIKRAHKSYDHLYIAIGNNPDKSTLFTVDQRLHFIKRALELNGDIDMSKITITHFDGLATDFMRTYGIGVSVRGVRNTTDVEYENKMNLINRAISGNKIETVYFPCDPKYEMVSSSTVKMLVKSYVDVSEFVCTEVKVALEIELINTFLVGIVGQSGSGKTTYCKENGFITIDFDEIVRQIWSSDQEEFVKMREQIFPQLMKVNHRLIKQHQDGNFYLDKAEMRTYIENENNNIYVRQLLKPFIDIVYRKRLAQSSIYRSHMNYMKLPIRIQALIEKVTGSVNIFGGPTHLNIVALDAPMLLEYNGLSRVNNTVINVVAPDEVCVERIMERDGITEEQAKARLRRQLSTTEIQSRVRRVVGSSGYGCYERVDGD